MLTRQGAGALALYLSSNSSNSGIDPHRNAPFLADDSRPAATAVRIALTDQSGGANDKLSRPWWLATSTPLI